MKNKQLINIAEGILTAVVGVLIAVFGIQTVVDMYFGILFLVLGAVLLVIELASLVKVKKLEFGGLFAAFAFIIIGSFLVAGKLSFGVLIGIFVALIIALGGALMFYGCYALVKTSLFYGIGQIVIGAIALTMGILYLTVPEFATAFWIVIGILIALYGVLLTVFAIVNKKD